MRKFISNIIIIGLLLAVGYYWLAENGYNLEAILNKPKTIRLKAECSDIENLVLTSVTELTISNSGNSNYNEVTVRVTAYDENDDIIKQKNVVFNRILQSKGILSKPITLPVKAIKCNCVILNSEKTE
ncbi:MAG: hypothetical protein ABFR05_05350 [Bacteroidota bacterium]